ncbi:MAG: hypothetical protein MnENMB40S_15000 [Rhizobiaceae bacterium MnEN-MB40S]|nr:MAG: hypothetical protein MnENMB40S_15000 [Rhizobiaceae bacterium MnEN-MB40S]
MRLLVAVFFLFAALMQAAAQQQGADDKPFLEVQFDDAEAVPGEMLILRMTVMVPTFMPKPPVWPSLDMPNLLVRLSERSTNPTSDRINGETWSGLTRTWRISPMIAGRFTIPPQPILVTYSDPETRQATQVRLDTPTITLTGVIPEGAENLNPFISAENLKLEAIVEGDPETMKPGDGVVITMKAEIAGNSPMFLPRLLPDHTIAGIAIYEDEPAVDEKQDRGVYSGSRTERATLLAEGGATGEWPSVSLDWYNLTSRRVETATVDGFSVHVDGPPPSSVGTRDWRAIAALALAGVVLIAAVTLLLRWLIPLVRGILRDRRQRRLESEQHAFSLVEKAARDRDLSRLLSSLDLWAGKLAGADPRFDPGLRNALTAIGAARFGASPSTPDASAWRRLRSVLGDVRREALQKEKAIALPPLNPVVDHGPS